MKLDETLCQRQPQTGPFSAAVDSVFNLLKGFENALNIFGTDTIAGIFNPKFDNMSITVF